MQKKTESLDTQVIAAKDITPASTSTSVPESRTPEKTDGKDEEATKLASQISQTFQELLKCMAASCKNGGMREGEFLLSLMNQGSRLWDELGNEEDCQKFLFGFFGLEGE